MDSRPASMASVAHGHALGASTRRTVVTTAMTNMKASSSSDSTSDLMTAAMTSAAMLSWTIARAAANSVEPGLGSRPTRYIVTVRVSSSTTARATGRPGSIVTRTPYAVRSPTVDGSGRRGTASADFTGRAHLWQTGSLRPVD